MKTLESKPTHGSAVGSKDLFSAVRPRGWLGERLKNISNPRKWRWKSYERACRRIPKSSPVHGTTSWKEINARRCALIEAEIMASKGKPFRRSEELQALQEVCDKVRAGNMVAQNFLLGRLLRKLKAENSEVSEAGR